MSKKPATYVNVAPAIPLPKQKLQTFTYRASVEEVPILHQLVQVPIGRRSTLGVVMDTHHQKPSYPTKPIKKTFSVVLTDEQIQFASWISDTMQGGFGYTLRLFYPPAPASFDGTLSPAPKKKAKQPNSLAYIEKKFHTRWQHVFSHVMKEIKQGGQALILVPEISMIEEIATVFENTHSPVWQFHAGMKSSHIRSVWKEVYEGNPGIVIGTQKSIFLPFHTLRHIVIAEEQLETHKLWDQYPRLDNRRAARVLADIHKAELIYSSSFSSLAVDHSIKSKEIILQGKEHGVHPQVHLMEVSFDDRRKNLLLPQELIRNLSAWKKQKQKILIYYNQLEKGIGKKRRSGTATIDRIFEKMPILAKGTIRIDSQTLKKTTPAELENAPIIIGTAAVLTVIDRMQFDRIVWLFPERMMTYPDFRSEERAWTLLARLQQHLAERRSITIVTKRRQLIEPLLNIPYDEWYEQGLHQRRRYQYPPYADLVRLTTHDTTTAKAQERATALRAELDTQLNASSVSNIHILGPFQDLDTTAKSRKQFHILLKGTLPDLVKLYTHSNVDIVDVDPQRIL